MNSRDEIIDAMDGIRRDLPPPAIFTQSATVSQMDACGASWPEANFDAAMMAELAHQASERFGFATVRVPFSIAVEAHALGCSLNRGSKSDPPSITGSPFMTESELSEVPELPPIEEFLADPWIGAVIDASGTLKEKEDSFVIASMLGPLALVNYLGGIENVLMGTLMAPDLVNGWMTETEAYQKAYASRLTEACDNVLVIEEVDTGLFSPDFFEECTSKHLASVIQSGRKESYCSIHSCGDTLAVAGALSGLGEDCLSAETSACMSGYVSAVGGRCRLLGAINPVKTLLQGTEADVMDSIRASIDAGFDLIGPECGVPPMTSDANLRALAGYRDALRRPRCRSA